MARRLGLKFYRSCVKEGLNVTEGARDAAQLHADRAGKQTGAVLRAGVVRILPLTMWQKLRWSVLPCSATAPCFIAPPCQSHCSVLLPG
jgi:hypothetical protein